MKSLQAKTIHGQVAGISARARAVHGEGSEQGRHWSANLGEAGAGRRRRTRPALAGGGGRALRWPAGAARRGCKERMWWGRRSLAVRRERRKKSCEEGQRGGVARSSCRLDGAVDLLYLSMISHCRPEQYMNSDCSHHGYRRVQAACNLFQR